MIVAGFGFRGRATEASLQDAFQRALGERTVNAVATVTDKSYTMIFEEFANATGLEIIRVDGEILKQQSIITHSDASMATRGTGSVAEASALAAAGPNARLLGHRVVSGDGMATCALAEGEPQ